MYTSYVHRRCVHPYAHQIRGIVYTQAPFEIHWASVDHETFDDQVPRWTNKTKTPAGMNRGAENDNYSKANNGGTHSSGSGGAQDHEGADYSSSPNKPDIEAIEIRPGVVDIYDVKIRNAGVVAMEADQLNDFRGFSLACIAPVQRAFDPPQSALTWSRFIDAALRKARRLERPGETLHLHGTPNCGDEEVEWTVHERIPRNGVGLLSGPYGSFKSFLLLEACGCVMTGLSFLGKKVRRRCGALIFAAEGANTIRLRKRALIEHRIAKAGLNPHLLSQRGVNLDALPFAFVGNCRPLLDPRTVDWIATQARTAQEHFRSRHGVDLGFLGIDTIAAAAGWDNENDAAQCQIVMNHLADISTATDTFVLAVDHFGQDITKGSRGSTAKESAAGTIFYVHGKGDNHGVFTNTELVLRKQRGGRQGMVFRFDAREVTIGTDRYGEPQTSRIIDWNVERDKPKAQQKKKPSAQALLEEVLATALDQQGTVIKIDGMDAVRAVRKDAVMFAFKTAYQAERGDADADAVSRAWRRALSQAKVAVVVEGVVDGMPYLWWLLSPV
jgi:hypothetical protein